MVRWKANTRADVVVLPGSSTWGPAIPSMREREREREMRRSIYGMNDRQQACTVYRVRRTPWPHHHHHHPSPSSSWSHRVVNLNHEKKKKAGDKPHRPRSCEPLTYLLTLYCIILHYTSLLSCGTRSGLCWPHFAAGSPWGQRWVQVSGSGGWYGVIGTPYKLTNWQPYESQRKEKGRQG